jgi:hypothetical protein
MKKEYKMKKIIFLAAVLLVVFSGVAAVSAYEGHVIDVKAHVENAIWVNGEALVGNIYEANLNYGTVFPEQSREGDIVFGLSNSFVAQGNTTGSGFSTVQYKLYWEPKPSPAGAVAGYYKDIWPYINLALNGTSIPKITASVPISTPILITSASLFTPSNTNGDLHFTFQAPVFDYWYNSTTDPVSAPVLSYNSGSGYNIVMETVTCSQYNLTATVPVPNVDLGNNLKIQVYSIIAHN